MPGRVLASPGAGGFGGPGAEPPGSSCACGRRRLPPAASASAAPCARLPARCRCTAPAPEPPQSTPPGLGHPLGSLPVPRCSAAGRAWSKQKRRKWCRSLRSWPPQAFGVHFVRVRIYFLLAPCLQPCKQARRRQSLMHGQLPQPCAHPQPSRGDLTAAPGLLQVGTRSPKSRTAERAHAPPHRGVHRGGHGHGSTQVTTCRQAARALPGWDFGDTGAPPPLQQRL